MASRRLLMKSERKAQTGRTAKAITMATTLEIQKEHCPGLYDSATGEGLVAEKVVDVTDDVHNERTVLLYTSAKRGRIVQITFPYPDEVYMGAHTHFFLDELQQPVRPQDDTFSSIAKRLGYSRENFRNLVIEHAPEIAVQ